MNLHTKIQTIQSELKAPKKQTNSFGGFNYRSAEDILEALKPHLMNNQLIQTISDKMIIVGDRVYVEATCTVTDGTDTISVTANAREPKEQKGMGDSQMTGSASSYARKYAMNGMWLIDDNKDGDFQPVWWNEAVAYLKANGKIEAIEKKYELTEELKVRLMDAAASG